MPAEAAAASGFAREQRFDELDRIAVAPSRSRTASTGLGVGEALRAASAMRTARRPHRGREHRACRRGRRARGRSGACRSPGSRRCIASGCPVAGVARSSSEPHPSAARQSASRTRKPACSARRTKSSRQPRCGIRDRAEGTVSCTGSARRHRRPACGRACRPGGRDERSRCRVPVGQVVAQHARPCGCREGDAEERALGAGTRTGTERGRGSRAPMRRG